MNAKQLTELLGSREAPDLHDSHPSFLPLKYTKLLRLVPMSDPVDSVRMLKDVQWKRKFNFDLQKTRFVLQDGKWMMSRSQIGREGGAGVINWMPQGTSSQGWT